MQELLTQPEAEQEEWDEVSLDDLLPEAESCEAPAPAESEAIELPPPEPEVHAAVDETLTAAAWQARQKPARRQRRENRGFVTALLLAVVAHMVLGAVCLAIVMTFRYLLPRVHFSRGQGSIDTGLVSDTATDGTAEQTPLPGPALPKPQVSKSATAPDAPSTTDTPGDTISESANTRATLASQEKDPDPVIVGIGPDTGGAPAWRPNFPQVSSPPPAPQPTGGTGATAAAAAQPSAPQVRHVLVPPKGMGHGGTAWGDAGSGFDSRGLPVPEYPVESKRRHEAGTVTLLVLVKADGTVGPIRLVQSSGFPRLDQAALDATRRATFSPATDNGTPVTLPVSIPFVFILR